MQAPALEIPRQTDEAFIRPFWGRTLAAPWCASVFVLVLLTCARAYGMLGPPSARPLFLLQFLAMWALPFVLLTRAGRREIGLRKPGNAVAAFFWSALAGAACALGVFALGLVLFGQSPQNWNVTVRDSFRLQELRGSMPGPLLFATIALPAMIFSPIGEEILFRGVIQQAFTRRWNASIATAVNSFSFGLVHLLHHGISRDAAGLHLQFLSGSLMVLLMAATSYVFTLCRLRSGSLWPAMVAHSTCNLVMIVGIFLYFT
jgi:membrane protease YdiL (CAAX protease family)